MNTDALMQKLNIQVTGESDGWVYCYCPFHNNTNTRSAEISLERGYFYCFSCSTYISLVDLAMRMLNISPFEALRLTQQFKQEELTVDFDFTLPKQDFQTVQRLQSNLLQSIEAQEWLKKRGIYEQRDQYRIGFSTTNRMITLPVDHPYNNSYVGITARSINNKIFKHSPGLPKKYTLFGLHHARQSPMIYLTESPFDAIMVTAAGTPAVASLGNISQQQIHLLSRWSTIVVLQDNDQAGSKMVATITKQLPKHNIKSIEWPDKQFKDVGESGTEYLLPYIR